MQLRTKVDPENLLLLARLPRGSTVTMTKDYPKEEIYHLFAQLGFAVRVNGRTVERPENPTDEDVVNTVAIASNFKSPIKMSFRFVMDRTHVDKMVDDQYTLYPHLSHKRLVLLYDCMFIAVKKGVKK